MLVRASPNSDVTQMGKSLSEMQATWVRYLGQEDTLDKELVTHSRTLEISMDGGTWWAKVHGVTKSQA